MRRLALCYGVACYITFLVVFLYLIFFIAGFVVPKTLDTGEPVPMAQGLLVDGALIALFGLQHSVMARGSFKSWWTLVVPECMERSTYVLATSLVVIVLIRYWQPLPENVWRIDGPLPKGGLYAISALGWGLVLFSSFLTNHWDLFGLRQTFLYSRGRRYTPVPFKESSLYRLIRHPMMLGVLLAVWATPEMTVGHLVLAVGFSAYIVVGVHFEEQALRRDIGDRYVSYQRRTVRFFPFY
jgi:protein-S-isoprenylcysteine O-methyltransferase Ste14